MATGYCLKCKKQVDIQSPQAITMKNGKPAGHWYLPDLRHENLQDRQGSLAPAGASRRRSGRLRQGRGEHGEGAYL